MTKTNSNKLTPHTSSPLKRFEEHLPAKPYASRDLQRLIITSRNKALDYPYIQPNDPFNAKWLVFDIDLGHQSFFAFDDANLPPPNLIIQNPDNGNCHLFYGLKTAVWTKGTGSKKAENYLNAIKRAMTEKLGADKAYSGLISKNPFHSRWRTTERLVDVSYELDDLADYLELDSIKTIKPRIEPLEAENGRNDCLFNTLRKYAYKNVTRVKRNHHFEAWTRELDNQASTINQTFADPLPLNEIRHTVKSVEKWVWNRYTATKQKRDTLKGAGLTLREKQTLSALTTNKQRTDKTQLRIKQAIIQLNNAGQKVTQKAVANQVKLSVRTMGRYKALFKQEKNDGVAIQPFSKDFLTALFCFEKVDIRYYISDSSPFFYVYFFLLLRDWLSYLFWFLFYWFG